MALRYFSHDVNASRDMKCVKLVNAHGLAGYGLFWRIIETLYETFDCEMEYDLPGLSALFNCDQEFVRCVVEDFGLFEIKDGVFWSESAKTRFDAYREAEEAKKERRSELARKAGRASAQARKVKNGKEKTKGAKEEKAQEAPERESSAPTVVPCLETPSESLTEEEEDYDPDDEPLGDKIIALWNNVFGGSVQEYRGLTLDSAAFARVTESLKIGRSLDDFAKAFQIASEDDFPWRLKDAVKPDNIQLLLTKGVKNERRQSDADRKSDTAGNLGEWDEIERRYLRDEL